MSDLLGDCLQLPGAWPQPGGVRACSARLRQRPRDFQVDEELGFAPDGEGEHTLLRLRKTGCNTAWVARRLAEIAGVRVREVSYAGLKDRDAVTSQWFSVWLPARTDPDWSAVNGDGIELLEHARHRRKLRRGCHRGNHFRLTLTELRGESELLERALVEARDQGVPNYFGPQRFGHGGGNLQAAQGLFRGDFVCRDRQRRGLYLSAARSLLFNRVLAARVADASWNRALPGDVLMLDGSRSIFDIEQPDAVIDERMARRDLHPTAPLWGIGTSRSRARALEVERGALQGCAAFMAGLEAVGMKQERRALRLLPAGLRWGFASADELTLEFSLPSGSYATTVVAAVAEVDTGTADAGR